MKKHKPPSNSCQTNSRASQFTLFSIQYLTALQLLVAVGLLPRLATIGEWVWFESRSFRIYFIPILETLFFLSANTVRGPGDGESTEPENGRWDRDIWGVDGGWFSSCIRLFFRVGGHWDEEAPSDILISQLKSDQNECIMERLTSESRACDVLY